MCVSIIQSDAFIRFHTASSGSRACSTAERLCDDNYRSRYTYGYQDLEHNGCPDCHGDYPERSGDFYRYCPAELDEDAADSYVD